MLPVGTSVEVAIPRTSFNVAPIDRFVGEVLSGKPDVGDQHPQISMSNFDLRDRIHSLPT